MIVTVNGASKSTAVLVRALIIEALKTRLYVPAFENVLVAIEMTLGEPAFMVNTVLSAAAKVLVRSEYVTA